MNCHTDALAVHNQYVENVVGLGLGREASQDGERRELHDKRFRLRGQRKLGTDGVMGCQRYVIY